ncbi:NAD(P)-binding protein [Hesseltinella vesiculosa]|uniref:NAD(P)-binding protein n=1 Tax=Hesseltinella vesiculosa TaxID=101127 RepID=A0A1X2G695_9FUNG|nr:NAD(P)-binding protein [Hesseltinella vesiculosa]
MDLNKLFDVKDKVVLVTGGGRGIGLMITQGFVSAGAKVYIASRTAKVCDQVAAELTAKGPGVCVSLPADLSKLDECQRLAQELAKHEDHLDVLVCNSGTNYNAGINEYPDEMFDKVLTLNLKRIFSLTQACLPLLTAKSSAANPSRVINIGSIDGIRPPVQATFAYSTSKAGLHHLTKHLAAQLAEEHILVNAIAPGAFRSKMMAATLEAFEDVIVSKIPVGRIGEPEDIAGTAIYLASRAGAYTNGAVLVVDGGVVASAKM